MQLCQLVKKRIFYVLMNPYYSLIELVDKPFVEILNENGSFVTKEVEVGISDEMNVEILKGVKEGDKIKVWNSIEEDGEEEDKKKGSGPGDTDNN